MTIYQRIRYLREKLNMSQQELAMKVGYQDKSAISKVERGERDINQSMIVKYAEALGVNPTYLLFGNSKDLNDAVDIIDVPEIRSITTKKFPMLGEIACGEPKYACEEYECYVDTDEDIDADFCLTAKGDSMIGARIMDGDIVFIKRMPIVNNGEIAAVLIDDETTLKRVYYYPEEHRLSLWAENPKYSPLNYMNEELDNIRILGKAVAFQSRIK